jgi:hypothetical protein
MSASLTF